MTGVQTCALPIWAEKERGEKAEAAKARRAGELEGFAGTEESVAPGVTDKVAAGAPATVTTPETTPYRPSGLVIMENPNADQMRQQIAAQRLAQESDEGIWRKASDRAVLPETKQVGDLNLRRMKSQVPMHLDWTAPGATTEGEAKSAAGEYKTVQVEHPMEKGEFKMRLPSGQEGSLAQKARSIAVGTTGEAAPAEATKAPIPKTIGEATDAQLGVVKAKLEDMVKAAPGDALLAKRLQDVNDEMEYRKTEKAPVTYDQWAEIGRAHV